MKKSDDQLIKEAKELAESYYREKEYLCSEAVLAAINEVMDYGMPKEYIKMASGFPVGMGGAGCSCGALSGAQMALGLAYGRKKPGGSNRKIMKLSQEMHNQFKEQYKSTCCRVLIKDYKFGSKEHIERCTNVTGDVCELATNLILNNRHFLSKVL